MEILFYLGMVFLVYVLFSLIGKFKKTEQQKNQEEHKIIITPGNNDVIIEEAGTNKFALLKEVRDILSCDLVTGKNIVDGLPYTILTDISEETANDIKTRLEKIGAVVTIQTK